MGNILAGAIAGARRKRAEPIVNDVEVPEVSTKPGLDKFLSHKKGRMGGFGKFFDKGRQKFAARREKMIGKRSPY